MPYVKIENGIVVQKQPDKEEGFIKVSDNVICGMIQQADGSFIAPVPVPKPYTELRREAYPPIGDQLDAIWKELNYRRMKGNALIQEADDLLNDILNIKKKYPKA